MQSRSVLGAIAACVVLLALVTIVVNPNANTGNGGGTETGVVRNQVPSAPVPSPAESLPPHLRQLVLNKYAGNVLREFTKYRSPAEVIGNVGSGVFPAPNVIAPRAAHDQDPN